MQDVSSPVSFSSIRVRAYTWMKVISTAAFSGLGELVINITTIMMELHSTQTAQIGSILTKLTLYKLLNAYVVAVLAIEVAGLREDVDERQVKAFWCADGRCCVSSCRVRVMQRGCCPVPHCACL